MPKTPIVVRFPESEKRAAEHVAKADGVSLSAVIREGARRYIAERLFAHAASEPASPLV